MADLCRHNYKILTCNKFVYLDSRKRVVQMIFTSDNYFYRTVEEGAYSFCMEAAEGQEIILGHSKSVKQLVGQDKNQNQWQSMYQELKHLYSQD